MKSSTTKITFLAIYRFLDKVSPLDQDCGQLCGAACCTCGSQTDSCDLCDEDDFGIYLLPGEDKVFDRKEDWIGWEKIVLRIMNSLTAGTGPFIFFTAKQHPAAQEKNALSSAVSSLWLRTWMKKMSCISSIRMENCLMIVP